MPIILQGGQLGLDGLVNHAVVVPRFGMIKRPLEGKKTLRFISLNFFPDKTQ